MGAVDAIATRATVRRELLARDHQRPPVRLGDHRDQRAAARRAGARSRIVGRAADGRVLGVAPGLADRLRELARPQVVVTGIETHVCVNQTVHGLLAAGCQPHVVRDPISARFALEDETGFAKLVGSGAVPGSVESVLFEWLRDSRNPAFKAVQKLVV